METIQIISVILQLLSVWFTRSQNTWCWSTGLLGVLLHGYVLLKTSLIGQAFVFLAIFTPAQIWGWCCWKGIFTHKVMIPTWLHTPQRFFLAIIGIFLGYVWYKLWHNFYPNPHIAIWDTTILAASIVGMWLQIYKKVECWIVWLIPVNISSAVLFYQLHNYPFTILYCVLCILAVLGLLQWNQAAKGNIR